MPGSYLIDVRQGIVFTRGWGVLTDDDLLSHAEILREDPRLLPGFRQIVDFRELSEMRATSGGVSQLAQRNPFPREARRAIVAPSDAAFGMARMFEVYMEADEKQFRVFRELGPAMEWVGLDPATPWPTQTPDALFGID